MDGYQLGFHADKIGQNNSYKAMNRFDIANIELTKYLFFTGKGGVGKTSLACATAVGLADSGKHILLISTDPASNLQDVFNQTLNGHGTDIQEVPGLTVVNLDPETGRSRIQGKRYHSFPRETARERNPKHGGTTFRFLHGRDCGFQPVFRFYHGCR